MANKKINQLVSKTAILSTDIFGIGDATTGQLFKKTIAELQAAIGGAVISVNGLVGTVVLDTDDIQELATPTNKYFTDARARGAISLTVTGNSGASTYSSGTGVLNVPTYTLAGLGGITASFLSGTSGISYNSTTGVISYSGTVYTDASIRALLSGGTGISYNSTTGAISYSGTVYTDSSVRALISLTTTGTSGASTYNNTTGVINVPEYTLAGLGGISLTSLSGGTGITYNTSTGAISYSGTVYTDASVRALISATGNISYNSTTGVISTSLTQYTDALARASISITTTGTSGASTYNSTTGVINVPQYQGVITLTTTGTSGAATFSANTLNIPNYGSALSGYLPLTGGTLTGALTGTTATFSGLVSLGGASATNPLSIRTADGESYIRFLNADGSTYGDFERSITGSGAIRFTGAYFRLTGQLEVTGAATFSSSVTSSLGSSGANFNSNAATTGSVNAYRVSNTTGTGSFGIDNSTGGDLITGGLAYATILQSISNTALQLGTNQTARMTITTAGNVGIGSTTPSDKLHVTTTSGNGIKITTDDIATLKMTISSGNLKNWGFATNNTAASDFGIFQSTSNGGDPISAGTAKLYFAAGGNIAIGYSGDAGYKLYVSGTIYATGNITANSDLTLKKNLTIIDNPTDKLMQLNGYAYQWKSDDSHQYGVIAQEVEKILPYAVSTGYDGIKGVSYNQIIPVLIEAVKEQKAKIENLEILLASK